MTLPIMRGFGGHMVQPLEDPVLSDLTWVRFNGSTGGIAAQEGVSSVTQNGTGDFTITWQRPFATASSYACLMTSSCANPFSGGTGNFDTLQTITATSVRTGFTNYLGAAGSPAQVHLAAIGEF